MKKIFYLSGIFILLLTISCNNEDIPQSETISEVKKITPIVEGTFGKWKEADSGIRTKAGVIEDTVSFDSTIGEKFRWHNGDNIKLLFYKDGDLVTSLNYVATVDAVQLNKASFATTGNIPPDTYQVYGLYPAEAWTVNGSNVSVSYNLTQAQDYVSVVDATSQHLGRYMFMKADAGNVTIGENESNSINLQFKQLTSVLRVRINNSNPPNPTYTRLYRLSMGVDGFASFFNSVEAELDGGISGTELIPVGTKFNATRIQIPNEITNLNMLDFDLFIPILPTGSLEGNSIQFIGTFYDQGGTNSTQAPPISMNFGPNFKNLGFEAGKSYFFNLTVPEIP